MRRRSTLASAVASLALVAATALGPAPAQAQTAAPTGSVKGPAPTASLGSGNGPYRVAQERVSSAQSRGFAGGTIYYPQGTDEVFGGVAISPPFTAQESSVAWLGPRLASQGFVVMTFNTNTRLDQPAQRGRQLLAALEHLTQRSGVRDRVDPGRLAVMGHSMGGGGALDAARTDGSIKAVVPLAAWNTTKNWSSVRVPTLVVAAENDAVAPVRSHSRPFYESLGSSEKAYLELAGAGHFVIQARDPNIAKYSIAWLKRFVDGDTRYDAVICGGDPAAERAISVYQATCPLEGGGATPPAGGAGPVPAPAPAPAPAPVGGGLLGGFGSGGGLLSGGGLFSGAGLLSGGGLFSGGLLGGGSFGF